MDHPLPTAALPEEAYPARPHCGRDAARLERQTGVLAELTDLGLRMARVVTEQAETAKWVGSDGGKLFSCILRAVRQTVALENRIVEDARKREQRAETGRTGAKHVGKLFADRDQTGRPKDQVRRVAASAIRRDADYDAEDTEDLLADLYERLDDPSTEAELGQRSVEDIVAGICRDLGITLDLSDFAAVPLDAPAEPERDRAPSPQAADFAVGLSDRIDIGRNDTALSHQTARPARGAPGRDPPGL